MEKLIGFVYGHENNYSIWNVELSKDDMKAIQEILEKYETDGCSISGDNTLSLMEIF